MAKITFSKQQQERLKEMYHDSSVSSKDFAKIIEEEMNYVLPYTQVKYVFETLLGLNLRKRPRKGKDEIEISLEEDEPLTHAHEFPVIGGPVTTNESNNW